MEKTKNSVYRFKRAIEWLHKNTINENGITVTSKEQIIYPEVTGYYIPTLLKWGERNLAISYAKYLISIQKENGAWFDSAGSEPYVFDSAQILKGLIAIRNLLPEVDIHIIRGCDWILTNMQSDGQLTTPSKYAWGADEGFCSELIHIYCLSPIKEAGELFGRHDYIDSVEKILAYYKREKMEKIKNFSLLSHFYAYVMEGLYDLGEIDLCRESMLNLEKYRNSKMGIPGLNDVPWVCSTGLFQLALVWYKLGELEKGNSLFDYALSFQNKSGGWYGSYYGPSPFTRLFWGRKKPFYFPKAEISWAVKYFLDALALKEKLEFEKQAPIFLESIDANDGRYELIKKTIEAHGEGKTGIDVCDIGCGKGRYLKNLLHDLPNNNYFGSDLSETVVSKIDFAKEIRIGSLTDIPYETNRFDVVYVCEAFEHSINIQESFRELFRVTKHGGKLIIIDKPIEKLGQLEIDEWEQWIDDQDIETFTQESGGSLQIIPSVPYEGRDDGLFRAWVITK